ncbi:MAG: sugar phosphate isomerase/epimerase [Holosporaceae bacterium]|jgi:endonuclease IV|nr:sugar phosphate isomerase/epimerase [Holosporaceae bacterium]
MRQFGICLETGDFIEKPDFVDQILGLVKDGIYDFAQLIVLADSYAGAGAIIREKMLDIRTVIHAPFYDVDMGNRDLPESNLGKLKDAQKFADLLYADIIIVHPGKGDGEEYLRETIRQFQLISDLRIAVENLPYNPHGRVLHGSSPENIKRIIDETECKFCFDLAHAICAANSLGRNVYDDFAQYNALRPSLYHLSDGDFSATVDHHLHLGFGNYDIAKILREFIPEDAMIVLETRHENATTADLWIKDMQCIKELELNEHF